MTKVCEHYYGGCPSCGECEFLNVGGNHYGACRTHRMRWSIGYNLLSGWRDEPLEHHAHNQALLTRFTEVEPLRLGQLVPETPSPPVANDNASALDKYDPGRLCQLLSDATGVTFVPMNPAMAALADEAVGGAAAGSVFLAHPSDDEPF